MIRYIPRRDKIPPLKTTTQTVETSSNISQRRLNTSITWKLGATMIRHLMFCLAVLEEGGTIGESADMYHEYAHANCILISP
jgi:hypothetical protein